MDKDFETQKKHKSRKDLELDYTDAGIPVHLDHSEKRHKTEFQSYKELDDFSEAFMEDKENL